MPGRTVGRVYIDVDVDGKRLPGEVRALGKEAGAAGGDEFQKAWSKELTGLGQSTQRELGKAGKLGGQSFSEEMNGLVRSDARKLQSELVNIFGKSGTFDGLAGEFDSVGLAVRDVEDKMSHLRDMNMLTDEEFTKMQGSLRVLESDFTKSSRATEKQAEALNALNIDLAEARQAIKDNAALEAAEENARRDRIKSLMEEGNARAAIIELRQTREKAVTEGLLSLNQRELDLLSADADARRKSIALRERQLDTLAEDLGLTREVAAAQDEAAKTSDRHSKALGRSSKAQKEFGDNTRLSGRRMQEWQVWAIALTGGAGDIATLGSAAGAGIAIVGTAAAASAVGLGVLIAGFQGMTGELSGIAAEARPAASALKEMGGAFSEIQDQIQGKMFAGLEDEITGLTTNLLPVLSTGFQTMASEINAVFSELGTSLQTPAALSEIGALLDGFAPIFGNLLRAVIEFGAGLGGVFVLALPYAQQFASYLAVLGAKFNEYVGSAEGQTEINGWLEQGARVLAALDPLLGAIGTLFAELVTPETIDQVVNLINNLTLFMPVLTEILTIFAQLNIFGLVALALNVFGQALMPLMPSLQLLASVVADLVALLITSFAPVLGQLAAALAPVVETFALMLAEILPPLIAAFLPLVTIIAQLAAEVLPPLMAAIAPLIVAFAQMAADILVALMPAFVALIPAIVSIFNAVLPLVPLIVTLVAQFGVELVNAIILLVPSIVLIIETLTPLIVDTMPILIQLVSDLSPLLPILADLFTTVVSAIIPLLPPILDLITLLLPPLIELMGTQASVTIPLLVGAIGVLSSIFSVMADLLSRVVVTAVELLKNNLETLISFVTNVFQGDWEGAWNAVERGFSNAWDIIKGAAQDAMTSVVDGVNNAIGAINGLLDTISKISGGAIDINVPTIPVPKLASGGILDQATLNIAGEAGREAFVPLERPLSQISPDVRPLAAFAQGKVAYGGGEGQTIQRQVIIHEGAIKQIVTSPDANIAASQVLDRLVASL